MGSVPDHQRKARHNEKFFRSLVTTQGSAKEFPDWCITCIFYVALQYVDGKLAKMNKHPMDHETRDLLVANNFRKISDQYQLLKDRSETARYFPDSENKFNETDIRTSIDKLSEIEPKNGLQAYSTQQRGTFA